MPTAFIYIIIAFSLTAKLFAEVTPYQEACKEYWEENNNLVETPQKWDNESAIILYRYTYNSYEKVSVSSEIEHKNIQRQRIKLIDKSAISKYSEFKFDPIKHTLGEYKNLFGIKIIKPSGKEEIIDLAQAVDIKNGDNVIKKKIAIPNLNIGDIIDYFYVKVDEMSTSAKYKFFTPVYYSLIGEYPILNQKVEFKVLRRCYINFKSINGAPDITTIPSENDNYDSYAIIDKNRERAKDNNWVFKYRQLPTIKFQVAYSKSGNKIDSKFFPGKPGVIKRNVSDQEILTLVQNNVHDHNDGRINEFFKTSPYDELKGKELLAKINEFFKVRMKLNELRRFGGFFKNMNSDFQAINYISTYLKYRDIQHDVIIAPRKHLASIDNIIMVNDLIFFLKVTIDNKTHFIYPPSPFSNHDEINPEAEGVEAFEMKLYPNKSNSLQKITLPSIEAKDNISTTVSRVRLDDEDDYKLAVFDLSTYKHVQKTYKQNIFPFSSNEMIESTPLGFYTYGSYYAGDFYNRLYRNNLLTTPSMNNISWGGIIRSVKNSYADNIEDYDYNVTESGMSILRPDMVIDSYCKLKNYVYKIGDNYLLDAGKLIGSQLKISEENLDRKQDIYAVAARTYKNTIYINIPKGYIVKGLQKFNKNIDNACGAFTSSATVDGNQIVIQTQKTYKHSYEPVENWSKLLEMLDVAWELSQTKILLKKVN